MRGRGPDEAADTSVCGYFTLGGSQKPTARNIGSCQLARRGRAPRSAVTNCNAQNGWAQYSTGRMLPCLTVMSCGEIEADASVASSLPAIFGLIEIDQAKAITATAAIAARIMRLCICRLLILGRVAIVYEPVSSLGTSTIL